MDANITLSNWKDNLPYFLTLHDDKSGVSAHKSGQSNTLIEGTNGLLPFLWDAHELEICIAQYLEHVLHEV